MNPLGRHPEPVGARRARLAAIGALAMGALLAACGEGPTEAAFEPPVPQFAKPDCSADPNHPSCKDDGGGDDGGDGGAAFQFVLTDPPAGTAGVFSDAGGPYPSTMLDEGAGLHPTCDVRLFELKDVVSPGVISQSEMDAIIANQSKCDGATGGSDPRRAFLKAPGILTLTDDCDSDPNTAIPGCPFDTYPSYEWKGNRIKPTGWFSNAARHFEVDQAPGYQLTWVFQDPKVTIVARDAAGAPTSWRFEATTIHLYGHPSSELCVGGGDANQDGVPDGCLNFALSVDFTIEPEGS